MKKTKKILSIIIPIVLVVVIGLGIILPTSLADKDKSEDMPTFSEQIIYANGVAEAEDTGASTSSAGYKGGAIYLEQNCTFDMKGGTISGHKNKYGGAIYVSKGATFTMTGGTIVNNTADYGGAIYVESGGFCYIDGGYIINNICYKLAPAIYVEDGATLRISSDTFVSNNKKMLAPGVISDDLMILGDSKSTTKLHYMYYGNYPQSYVGSSMNDQLEDWFNSEKPEKSYSFEAGWSISWDVYEFLGEFYTRGKAMPSASDLTFSNGEKIKSSGFYWFKVEPILWYVLNYDEWVSGKPLEVMSVYCLSSGIPFTYGNMEDYSGWHASEIREWLNGSFYDVAFSKNEKTNILLSDLYNTAPCTSDYLKPEEEWTGVPTQDWVYLPSTATKINGITPFWAVNNPSNRVQAYGTDFAVANTMDVDNNVGETNNVGVWCLRTDSSNPYYLIIMLSGGIGDNTNIVLYESIAIRPAMRLSI